MTAIRPLAPCRCGVPLARVTEEDVAASMRTRGSTRSLTRARAHDWRELLLRPDIDGYIVLHKLRCLITLVSFALLVTDIPRTSLGVRNLQDFYPEPLMPSTAVRFGPFNYPVTHIWIRRHSNNSNGNDSNGNAESAAFFGLEGTKPISGARVWPYQYDTTSVGLRGAVELLSVSEFPAFLLYKDTGENSRKNADSLLDLSTAFSMLDAFISAAQLQLQPEVTTAGIAPTPWHYATKHNWVDRIHHVVMRFISKKPAWRLHSLHVPHTSRQTRSLAICSTASPSIRSSRRPRFCNHPGIWKCAHALNASLPSVRLWDHMDLRFQSLQQRYPDLVLDVALISTQRLTLSSGAMRTTSYNYEALEVVVLTRGRRCTDDGANSTMTGVNCTTVFVDDYRYERDIVQTNLTDWYGVISMLRGGAQCYVWARLALLVYGASVATAHAAAAQTVAGNPPSKSHLFLTISTVLKIPFQVIVYSSPLPVAGYVLALLLDSNFMDIFLDSYWASVSGAVNFRLVPFLESTAVQMRNVWLLALLANLLVSLVRKTRDDSSEGMPGIRGLIISFTSTLTVLGPYKKTTFRDVRIVNMFRIPHTGQTMDIVQSNPGGYFNTSSYIFGDSASMLVFCAAFVAALAVTVKALGYFTPANGWLNRSNGGVVLSSTPIVPCGTATLWPTSALSIRFYVMARPPPPCNGPRASYVRALATPANPLASVIEVLPTNDSTAAPVPTTNLISPLQSAAPTTRLSVQTKGWPWPSRVQPGGPINAKRTIIQKEPLGGLRSRTTETHSVLQLMNIAMMTDPWNLFWLRVLGIQLYLYKIRRAQSIVGGIRSSSRTSYAVILPYREDEMEERTGLNSGDYLLLDSASSRDVPMAVLLQCG